MRFRKGPGRPGPVGALAERFGAIAGPADGRRSGPGDHLMAAHCDPPHAQAPRHGRPQAAATGLQDPVREAAARRGAGDQPVLDGHRLIPVGGAGHPARGPSSAPAGAVRHPERREAPPPAPEPVARTGGDRRNGCGRNAAARSVDGLRRERRRLRAVVPQDGPASNGPRIARLRRHGLRSVPGAKPGGHAPPLASPGTRAARFTGADGALHELRCLNGAPASASRPDIGASVTGCRETVTGRKRIVGHHRGGGGGGGERKGLPWVTDLPVDGGSPVPAMRAARSRWRTGNGTPARRGTGATAPGPASGTESGA